MQSDETCSLPPLTFVNLKDPPGLDHVIVSDDLVPAELQSFLSALVGSAIWSYGWKSSSRNDRFAFWHAHGAGGGAESRNDCEPGLLLRKDLAPIVQLWELLKRGPLCGHRLLRAYANGHTYGAEGYPHRDSSDRENYWTTVYFAHEVWHAAWAGELVFFNQDYDEIVYAVFPRPGRVVIFPGGTPHCARGVSRLCPALRASIVLKTKRGLAP
jgi:SM-20-related protein